MSELRERVIDIINEIVAEGHSYGLLYDFDLIDSEIDNRALLLMVADLFTHEELDLTEFSDSRVAVEWKSPNLLHVNFKFRDNAVMTMASRWNSHLKLHDYGMHFFEGHLDWRGEVVPGKLTEELRRSYIARLETNLARFR